MRVSSTCFLCGHFSLTRTIKPESLLENGWFEEKEKAISTFRNYYYGEFVDFFENGVSVYRKKIEKTIAIPLNSVDTIPICIMDITLNMMPMNMLVFSVKLEFSDVGHNDMVAALKVLRGCGYYELSKVADFASLVINPLTELYHQNGGKSQITLTNKLGSSAIELYDYSFLVEHGNKFKIFQIVTTDNLPADANHWKKYISCLGTLSHLIGNTSFDTETEDDYIDDMIQKGYVSVFKKWKMFALLDSVTILYDNHSIEEKLLRDWEETYFGKIYIYELYRKCFLYQLNHRFRQPNRDTQKLQNEMRLFERDYSFANISYNFLPQKIDSVIASVLESRTEEKLINNIIDKEMSYRDERRETWTNRLLLFLSVLAVSSAGWDLLSLVKDMRDHFELRPTLISLGVIFCTAMILLLIWVLTDCRRKN